MTTRARRRWVPILVTGAATLCVASVGAALTRLGPWYRDLVKPAWQPPDAAFGIVWTAIYVLAATAALTGWHAMKAGRDRAILLVLFAVNAALNLLWSHLFFGLQRPDWALIEVAPFWLSILALMVFIGRHDRRAALFLLPYLLWVAFAAALNAAVVSLNPAF